MLRILFCLLLASPAQVLAINVVNLHLDNWSNPQLTGPIDQLAIALQQRHAFNYSSLPAKRGIRVFLNHEVDCLMIGDKHSIKHYGGDISNLISSDTISINQWFIIGAKSASYSEVIPALKGQNLATLNGLRLDMVLPDSIIGTLKNFPVNSDEQIFKMIERQRVKFGIVSSSSIQLYQSKYKDSVKTLKALEGGKIVRRLNCYQNEKTLELIQQLNELLITHPPKFHQ